jgi:hypothetical protein
MGNHQSVTIPMGSFPGEYTYVNSEGSKSIGVIAGDDIQARFMATRWDPLHKWRLQLYVPGNPGDAYQKTFVRVDGLYPSHLEGDRDAIEMWQSDLIKRCNSLTVSQAEEAAEKRRLAEFTRANPRGGT